MLNNGIIKVLKIALKSFIHEEIFSEKKMTMMALDEQQTLMYREAQESPRRVAQQLALNEPLMASLGARLRNRPPALVITCGRGSSDHAATGYGLSVSVREGLKDLGNADTRIGRACATLSDYFSGGVR